MQLYIFSFTRISSEGLPLNKIKHLIAIMSLSLPFSQKLLLLLQLIHLLLLEQLCKIIEHKEAIN